MAYTRRNFKTKKALKEALVASAATGDPIQVYQPGPFGPDIKDGTAYLEGPHAPAAHSWYASCTVKDGCIVPGTLK
jgi:hypothetical protein